MHVDASRSEEWQAKHNLEATALAKRNREIGLVVIVGDKLITTALAAACEARHGPACIKRRTERSCKHSNSKTEQRPS
ncbi:hypothetical protein NDU88_005067 [Pleurodeles waltl]|uniref:Uncharacterized protein n=1 Tax=Pleurodeles waltl TaxID=8319 RepID=A0AAV7QH72_PLEWA|nr:hypothetical protein NDU88_005067 [Pleurodeles waltl]